MATIEFKNLETQTAFLNAVHSEDLELNKLRRMLYLVKSGLVWEAV